MINVAELTSTDHLEMGSLIQSRHAIGIGGHSGASDSPGGLDGEEAAVTFSITEDCTASQNDQQKEQGCKTNFNGVEGRFFIQELGVHLKAGTIIKCFTMIPIAHGNDEKLLRRCQEAGVALVQVAGKDASALGYGGYGGYYCAA